MTTPIDIAELQAGMVCLVPHAGAGMPSCHEFSVCDCQVKELIASLKIDLEALEKLEGWEMLFRLEGGLSYPPGPPTLIRETIGSPAREALAEIRKRVTYE